MTTETNSYKTLPEFLKTAIDNEIKRVTDDELDKVKEQIDKRKAEIIAGVVLYVEKELRFETMGKELRITVLLK